MSGGKLSGSEAAEWWGPGQAHDPWGTQAGAALPPALQLTCGPRVVKPAALSKKGRWEFCAEVSDCFMLAPFKETKY